MLGAVAAVTVVVAAGRPWFNIDELGIPFRFTGLGAIVFRGPDAAAKSAHYTAMLDGAVGRPGLVTAGLAILALAALIVAVVARRIAGPAQLLAAALLGGAGVLAAVVWWRPTTMLGRFFTAGGFSDHTGLEAVRVEPGLIATALAAGVGAVVVGWLTARRWSPRST